MTQETISRAELDADQARQETTFTAQVYQLAAGLQAEIHQLERRIYLVAAMATGLIIGAMQLD